MSHTTEADYKKQLEELRELHRQAVEDTHKAHDHQMTLAQNQKGLDDEEIAALKLWTIPVTSFTTPASQSNLSSNHIQAAVYIDEQRLNDALHGFGREIDDRLTILTNEAIEREDRMLQHMTALITSSMKNNAAPPSTVPQSINQNPSNVATQPNAPQSGSEHNPSSIIVLGSEHKFTPCRAIYPSRLRQIGRGRTAQTCQSRDNSYVDSTLVDLI